MVTCVKVLVQESIHIALGGALCTSPTPMSDLLQPHLREQLSADNGVEEWNGVRQRERRRTKTEDTVEWIVLEGKALLSLHLCVHMS